MKQPLKPPKYDTKDYPIAILDSDEEPPLRDDKLDSDSDYENIHGGYEIGWSMVSVMQHSTKGVCSNLRSQRLTWMRTSLTLMLIWLGRQLQSSLSDRLKSVWSPTRIGRHS